MAVNRLRPLLAALVLLLAAALAPAPAAAQPTDLLLSEYVEGSSLNKAVEIFNGTGAAIDLALGGYQLQVYFNGNPAAGATMLAGGTLNGARCSTLANNSTSFAGPSRLCACMDLSMNCVTPTRRARVPPAACGSGAAVLSGPPAGVDAGGAPVFAVSGLADVEQATARVLAQAPGTCAKTLAISSADFR